ncbi:MAG: hypothetical protein ACD_81C00168G0005 [uncultured bacterium]|nr:MAG: hypothetical protein ACD_81C00168G0005 [uncultured bacterium]HBI25683.1 hypothetical protein [Candidatus Wolfebacteria bacterium]
MNTQKFIIGLIIGLVLAGAVWYGLHNEGSTEEMLNEQASTTVTPTGMAGSTPFALPTDGPRTTPPTSPPPQE